jgi:hypothetical protein
LVTHSRECQKNRREWSLWQAIGPIPLLKLTEQAQGILAKTNKINFTFGKDPEHLQKIRNGLYHHVTLESTKRFVAVPVTVQWAGILDEIMNVFSSIQDRFSSSTGIIIILNSSA